MIVNLIHRDGSIDTFNYGKYFNALDMVLRGRYAEIVTVHTLENETIPSDLKRTLELLSKNKTYYFSIESKPKYISITEININKIIDGEIPKCFQTENLSNL